MMLHVVFIVAAAGYLVLVRSLRYRRINQLQAQHGCTPAQFQDLNYKDAQTIIGKMGLFEFPWVFLTGKDFAFLRAFAIPGISKVSVGAKEMVDRVGKRYADTTVLVGEFLVNDIDSERACIAINRMNWIHSRYRSVIKMDQMVYTLCLLTCEALQWIDMYDWRKTTPLEKHASWVFWNEVGRRMGLTDVPESFEACAAFIEDFETRNMRPTDDNALIAKGVFALYASTVPAILTPVVHAVITSFMDTRLCGAFKLAPSTPIISTLLRSLLTMRKHFVRHFMLPRYSTLQVFGEENASGYRPMVFWEIEPWYVPSASYHNWLHRSYTRFFGLPIAGDARFRPEGYKLSELGPKHLEGKGGEEVMSFVKGSGARAFTTFGQFKDTTYTRGGCPMDFKSSTEKTGCPMGFDASSKVEDTVHDLLSSKVPSNPLQLVARVVTVP